MEVLNVYGAVNAVDDHGWFMRHPDRTFRLRLASPEEASLAPELKRPGGVLLATVYRLGPGLRQRGFISVSARTAAKLLSEVAP
jgi:hypothetical protein